jgi:DNA-binding GntR family transcriptional regulator
VTDWTFDVGQPSMIGATGPEVVRAAVIEQPEALLGAIDENDAASAELAMREHPPTSEASERGAEELERATPRGAPSPRARPA